MIEHRVIGPPGTGKTTYLARQAVLAARRYGPERVVVASLTRTAAEEAAGRRTGLPRRNVTTLHAHAYRALGRPELAETPEGVKEWNDWARARGHLRFVLRGSARGNVEWAGAEIPSITAKGDALLQTVQSLRARMIPRESWPPTLDLGLFVREWTAWKQEAGRADFTDLIERALDDVPTIPGDPAVLMLDEAQDMSRIEMALARRWGSACEQMVVVGDPDQNLYEWRGTDARAFFGGPAASTRVLSQSYRVPRAVHAVASAWIGGTEGPREVAAYLPTGERGLAERAHGALSPLHAGTVVDQLVSGGGDGQTTMLLTTCGYMLAPVLRRLRRLGVPFHNPYRATDGGWNPMRSTRRLGAWLRPLRSVFGQHQQGWTWADVCCWIKPLDSRALVRGAKALAARQAAANAPTPDGAELRRMLFVDPGTVQLTPEWWGAHLLASQRSRYEYALAVARRDPTALARDPALIVGTIHSVKGGEADRVFLAPDLSMAGYRAWRSLDVADHDAVRRQFYVGMTRARHELHLLRPAAEKLHVGALDRLIFPQIAII